MLLAGSCLDTKSMFSGLPTPSLWRSAPGPRVLCISFVTGLFSVFFFFFLFSFFFVGRSFISVAIVADLHVRCPQFQRQQKDNPGLL